ncbi:MAG TPA: chloride channel protein [Anaerolineales bacterium]|nr:chloride channel protein [Anaerolineales bacterium]
MMGQLKLRSRLPHLLDRIQPSETAVLLGTAFIVGAGTGLGAVVFIRLIVLVQRLFFEGGESLLGFAGRGIFILAPAVGGLLAGPVIAYFAREAKGHGVPEVMQAIALQGGRIRPRVVLAKVVASALCIGSGGSAGREGPIVQVGAALGSSFGQWFHLSEARVRNLVACGAAAGIAATFNAPIAGVIFAMEIILGELRLGDMGNVVVSAVTASTVARVFLGDRPAFSIPKYAIRTPWEILLYALLGVLAAITAVAFIKVLYSIEARFDRARLPEAIKPAIGGLMLGGLAFFYPMILSLGFVPEGENLIGLPLAASFPHIFGSGFPVIEATLLGKLSIGLLVALIILKPLATSLTLGSGNSGGVFAPALFTGAALGGAFGLLVEKIAPGATAGPGAFATVGMAAVFAGAAHAPFTGFLIVFEMTDDYRLIIPLMAGVIVSHIVSERLHRDSIYTFKLTLRGIRLESGRDIDAMESVQVDEVMVKDPATVPTSMPIAQLASEFLRTGRHGFPVLNDDGSLYGVVSLEDYRRAATEGDDQVGLLVRDIATRDMVTVSPNETVGTALRRMAPRDLSRLPVVDRRNPRRLLGVVRRNDIVRAYDIALARRTAIRSGNIQAGAKTVAGLDATEITVEPSAVIVGKRVGAIGWPRECVIATIRRKESQIIPHGDTTIEPGDILVIVGDEPIADQIRSLCRPNVSS